MEKEINEMKGMGMFKKVVAAGMKKAADRKFAKKQAKAVKGNTKLKAMFDPKSSYQSPNKINLEPGRAARADVEMKKVEAGLK